MPEPRPAPHLVGILLAAGAGTRFGADKLLVALPDGSGPLVVAAARALRASLPDVRAVIRPGAPRLAELLHDLRVRVIINPAPSRGLGTSIACGVSDAATADGWLIVPGDMPWLTRDSVETVAAALRRGAPLAAPVHDGQRGHPVGFASRFGAELRALDRDIGARHLLQRHAAELQSIPVNDPGVLRDVDTPADLVESAP